MAKECGLVKVAGPRLSESERDYLRNHPKLGKISDVQLGKLEGVSKFVVARYRRQMGIPPFAKPRQVNEISELMRKWRR